MKLKEKILYKALELFQEKGISTVSPNQIAAALSISTGALTYHYKTKAVLIREVYEKMDAATKDFMKVEGYLTLNDFRKMMNNFQDFMRKHNFFFQDLTFIINNYPEIARLYAETNVRRLKQGKLIFDHYVKTGRMIPETEGVNYVYLTHNVYMVGAFWNIQSKVFNPTEIFEQPVDLVDMAWYMILPYLTDKGKEEYNQINEFLSSES